MPDKSHGAIHGVQGFFPRFDLPRQSQALPIRPNHQQFAALPDLLNAFIHGCRAGFDDPCPAP